MPLNGVGRAQAEAVGLAIAALDPASLDFLASPLGRTRETMQLLRAAAGLAPGSYRVDPRFAELRFGSWEGFCWKELRRQQAKLYAERERDRWAFRPPGGGESYDDLTVRVEAALQDLTGPTVLVSHGGVARAVMILWGGALPGEALRSSIWQGRILRFDAGRFAWM